MYGTISKGTQSDRDSDGLSDSISTPFFRKTVTSTLKSYRKNRNQHTRISVEPASRESLKDLGIHLLYNMAKLVYFPVRGRGESIRYFLIDNNVPYEEVNAGPRENWTENWKPKMQFGQCPCFYDEDGFQLVQSNAILRYLGRKYKLYGTNDKEAALIDMVNDGVEDLRVQYTRMIYQNYEAGKEPFIKELSDKLPPFEKLLKPTGYIAGEKISWADYNLFDMLDDLNTLSAGCLDSYSNLKAYYERVQARPGIQKRRQTDAFKSMPINGNGKQ